MLDERGEASSGGRHVLNHTPLLMDVASCNEKKQGTPVTSH